MSYKARLLWWTGITGNPSRGNKSAFDKIGLKTELITGNFQPHHLQVGADFLFTGMIYKVLEWQMQKMIRLPIIIQGGGYGPNFLPDGRMNRLFEQVTDIPIYANMKPKT